MKCVTVEIENVTLDKMRVMFTDEYDIRDYTDDEIYIDTLTIVKIPEYQGYISLGSIKLRGYKISKSYLSFGEKITDGALSMIKAYQRYVLVCEYEERKSVNHE